MPLGRLARRGAVLALVRFRIGSHVCVCVCSTTNAFQRIVWFECGVGGAHTLKALNGILVQSKIQRQQQGRSLTCTSAGSVVNNIGSSGARRWTAPQLPQQQHRAYSASGAFLHPHHTCIPTPPPLIRSNPIPNHPRLCAGVCAKEVKMTWHVQVGPYFCFCLWVRPSVRPSIRTIPARVHFWH